MTRKKNKNQRNMLNDENAPIRYLMKEMDPSEEVLMERAMMEDDDLLIEVESLRQTLKRLDELPDKDPPSHVSESIIKYAAEKAESRKSENILSFEPLRYAAAAVVILSVSIGSFWMYEQNSEAGNDANATLNSGTSEARANLSDMAIPSLNVSSLGENHTEPWVDKSDVIYFQDQYNSQTAEYDSILKNSLQKLTPLSNPSFYNTGNRSIQMTGTGIRQ